jgi:KUP system potassium uptake protein
LKLSLVLGALGVVFGDIGTSPLYTLQECLNGAHGVAPDPRNVFGVISLIVWSVTLVVTLKYLAFLMRADNRGEGGIMSLLSLVPAKVRSPSVGRLGVITVLAILGAALLFGDGIITPAISVLSAIEGLGVATQKLKPAIIPLTVVILILLFAVQRKGTGGLGKIFGPVMILWFTAIAILGVVHILARPEILGALSPVQAVRFFMNSGWHGFKVLGGVVLSVTGGEALYADMGHFGKGPIRVAWLSLIYPSLILCYLGQGALLLGAPGGAAQPFYAMVPAWGIYPMVGLAAAATVIASQALISGVFSLTHQAIRLGYFPRLTVRHTSGEAEGQIYLPLVNWCLGGACILLVLAFRESSRLAAAFGLAVSGTMLISSVIFYEVTRRAWHWPRWKSGALLLFFLSFDVPFFAANTLKFLDGGYLPFAVGSFFVAVMAIWRIGRDHVGELIHQLSHPSDSFLDSLESGLLGRVPGTAVVMTSEPTGIPHTLQRMVQRFHVLYERILLVSVTTESIPHVAEAERFTTEDIGKGIFRVSLRYGFMDEPDVPKALAQTLPGLGITAPPEALVYILGRESFEATSRNKMGALVERIFDLMSRNAKNATDAFRIPPEQVVELGMRVDL